MIPQKRHQNIEVAQPTMTKRAIITMSTRSPITKFSKSILGPQVGSPIPCNSSRSLVLQPLNSQRKNAPISINHNIISDLFLRIIIIVRFFFLYLVIRYTFYTESQRHRHHHRQQRRGSVLPFSSCFHCSNLLYILRLNILKSSILVVI